MGGADGVEVKLLHQGNVLKQGGVGDGFAGVGMMIVAVDAFDEDALAVDEEVAFSHFEVTETEACAGVGIALGCVKSDHERVKVRGFVRPKAGIGNGSVEMDAEMVGLMSGAFFGDVERGGEGFFKDGFASRIVKLDFGGDASRDGAGGVDTGKADMDGYVEGGFAEISGKSGAHSEVGDVEQGGAEEKDFAMETGQPPLILVLNKRGVGPFDDDGDEFVFGVGFQQWADVEFGGETGILGETHGDAIEINGENAGGTAKMEDGAARRPIGGDVKRAAIDAGGIVGWNMRRQIGPGHLDVGVVWLAMALEFPIAGHLDGMPFFNTLGNTLLQGCQSGLRMCGEMEFPLSIEREEKGRGLALPTASFPG